MTTEPPKILDDACEFIVDCLHATAPTVSDGYPLIRTPNIGKGRLNLTNVFRVSEDTYQTWTKRAVPEPGDLILAREAPAGNVAIVKEGETVCLGQRTVHLRPDTAKVDPDFLCYFLLAPPQQGKLLAGEIGATAKHVNMKDIRRLDLSGLPSLPVQKAAGSLLAAYDDLVDNNRRRMALLEEAARQLYREWFVRLRFPGHEHTRITNGVPEGWGRRTLGSVAKVQSGFAFKSSTYLESGKHDIVTIKNVHDGNFVTEVDAFLDDLPEKMPAYCQLATGDILLSLTGNIGRTCLVVGDGYLLNQRVAKLVPRDGFSSAFTYFTFRESSVQKRIEAISYGVAQQNLSPVKMCDLPFQLPPARLVRQFADVAEAIIGQLLLLKQQNGKLRAARDLLLPRLMSGEIAV